MMAVHGPSGVGVVADTYPAYESRAMFVLPIVIEAVFILMEEITDSDILRMDSCKRFDEIVPFVLPSSRLDDR